MNIRHAVASDVRGLVDLEMALFDEADYPLSRRAFYYHVRRSLLLVAETDDGSLAGYLLVLLHRRSPKLYSLGVAPCHRGRGVAAALMERMLEILDAAGTARTVLEVRCGNDAALNLYRRFGYAVLKRLEGFYRDGGDAFLMERLHASQTLPPAS